jgi:methionine biosynthesis protein MetW
MTPKHPIRVDLQIIADLVPDHSRTLDLGCGDGDLLDKLIHEKQVDGQGLELYNEHIYECIAKGVPVVHGNLDEGLSDYPDRSFDYVILSRTLQEAHKPVVILREMVRVGKIGILSFPNFGYWRTRFQLFFQGRMPVTKTLPYEWYDTPNIHLPTVRDFKKLLEQEGIRIVKEIHLTRGKRRRLSSLWSNGLAELVIFVLKKEYK